MVVKAAGIDEFEHISAAIGRYAAVVPITPTTWTLLALVPAAGGLYALYTGALTIGIICFIFAGLLDVVDGAVARYTNRETSTGAYLDGMTDRVVEASLIIGLLSFGYPSLLLPAWVWLVSLLFLGTGMTSFARAYADHRGLVTDPADLSAMGGLLERPERLGLLFVSMGVWYLEPSLATAVIAMAAVLAGVTVLQRVVFALRIGGTAR